MKTTMVRTVYSTLIAEYIFLTKSMELKNPIAPVTMRHSTETRREYPIYSVIVTNPPSLNFVNRIE